MCKKLTSILLTFIIIFSMINVSAELLGYFPEGRAFEGLYWCKIVNRSDDYSSYLVTEPINVEPNTDYIMSVRVKGYGYLGASILNSTTWRTVARLTCQWGGNYDWQYTYSVFNTGDNESVLFALNNDPYKMSGTIYVDSVYLAKISDLGTNIVPDPGFELGTGWQFRDNNTIFSREECLIVGGSRVNNFSSIYVKKPKTEYFLGDEFVEPKVYVDFEDNSIDPLTDAFFTGYDMNTPGTQTVTAFCDGMTDTYEITVSDKTYVENGNYSKQLKTYGNKFVYADNTRMEVRLTGVNVSGAEWAGNPDQEYVERSVNYAIDNWHANLIRLPVSVEGWYGEYDHVTDKGKAYREYVDNIIKIAGEKGVYVILDLHEYGSFNDPLYLTFWQEAAVRYANNPTVLFGILNEPTGITWAVWRNGDGETITGHQQVVEMIRDLGAKNIIVAGGVSYSGKLAPIAGGYALVDQGSNDATYKAGYGIAYDIHMYPWNAPQDQMDTLVGETRKSYPIIVGQCGWQDDLSSSSYKPGDQLYYDQWVPAFLEWLDDETDYVKLSYAAETFNPNVSPTLVERDNWSSDDYAYPPTEEWGVYVKEHLAKCVSERYTVYQKPVIPYSKTQYVKSGNNYICNIEVYNATPTSHLIIAQYRGDEFIGVQFFEYTSDVRNYTVSNIATKIKVMLWDDMTEQNNLTVAETVEFK